MSKSGASDTSGTNPPVDVRMVEAVVVALIPEYRQVRVRDVAGNHYALTRAIQGSESGLLSEGQRVVCTVLRGSSRVLKVAVA